MAALMIVHPQESKFRSLLVFLQSFIASLSIMIKNKYLTISLLIIFAAFFSDIIENNFLDLVVIFYKNQVFTFASMHQHFYL